MIAVHQLFGVRVEVDLLVHPRCARRRYPVGHREAVQVMLQERQRHDQRNQPLPVVLDEAHQLGSLAPHLVPQLVQPGV